MQEIRLIRKYCEKMIRSERISEEEIVDALTSTGLLGKYNWKQIRTRIMYERTQLQKYHWLCVILIRLFNRKLCNIVKQVFFIYSWRTFVSCDQISVLKFSIFRLYVVSIHISANSFSIFSEDSYSTPTTKQ